MEDRELLALSIIASFLGLLMLFYLSQNLQPSKSENMKIGEISGGDIGRNIKVTGAIKKAERSKNKNFYGYLEDETGSIRFFIFSSNSSKIGCVEEGKKIEIFGKIEEFEGELEIVSSLDKLKC